MNEYARSGLIMIGLTSAMCGLGICLVEPMNCRQKELARRFELEQSRRTP